MWAACTCFPYILYVFVTGERNFYLWRNSLDSVFSFYYYI